MRNLNTAAVIAVEQTPARVIKVAAALADRYQNPEVAAFNRNRGIGRCAPSSARRNQFWHEVGRALGAAYGDRGCRSDYEYAMQAAINAARNH